MPASLQIILTTIGLVGYAAASIAAIRRFPRPQRGLPLDVAVPLLAGLAAVGILIFAQVVVSGSLLAAGTVFDAMLLIAWLIALEVLLIRWARRLRGIEIVLLPLAAVLQIVALAVFRSSTSGPQHLRQWHIIGHVAVITLAGACFIASGVAGAVYLVVHRAMRHHRQLSVLGRLPALESLEHFGRLMVVTGYPLLTFGILTGVCGIAHSPPAHRVRELIMGSGTIALWIFYGVALIVVWLRPRLRGPRAAALSIGAAGLTLLNFVVYLLMRSHT
jgi:ABC-type uncharacterized transport system permease subunit